MELHTEGDQVWPVFAADLASMAADHFASDLQPKPGHLHSIIICTLHARVPGSKT